MAELSAGRELDALVAEKVMGYVWRVIGPTVEGGHGRLLVATPLSPFMLKETGESDGTESLRLDAYADVPFYSENIAAAWTVVEHLSACGAEVSINFCATRQMCQVSTDFGTWVAHEEKIAHSICRAALAALGGAS